MNKYEWYFDKKYIDISDKEFKQIQNLDITDLFDNIKYIFSNTKLFKVLKKNIFTIGNDLYILQLIRNSGDTPKRKKRLGVYENKKDLVATYNNFFIIGFAAISKTENNFILTKNVKPFAEHYFANSEHKSYSSIWINDFESWEKIANKLFDFSNCYDKDGEYLYSIFSNLKILILFILKNYSFSDEELSGINMKIDTLDFKDKLLEFDKHQMNKKEDYEEEFDDFAIEQLLVKEAQGVEYNAVLQVIDDYSQKLDRNTKIIKAYSYANKICEKCNKEHTFINDKGEMYFEIHHFIPYNINSQNHFKMSLDNYYNLISLCAECHREIHLSEKTNRNKIISELFENKFNNKTFRKLYSELDLEVLFDIYSDTFNLK